MMGQIIIAILFLVLATIILIVSASMEKGILAYLSFIFVVLGISLIVNFHTGLPKAIDVYRGKTTLKITYEDGIPIDSIVVFKKNKKK